MRSALHLVLVSVLLLSMHSVADAARRLAFVVGIDNYQHIPKLKKAVGDATAMTAKLTELGFEVTPVLNPTRRDLNIAVGEFTAKLRRDDLVFVHFSGHGVEIDGDNILLPADIPKPKSGQKLTVKYEGIGLRRLIDQISATGARSRVFVIDACRDNPFEQSGVRAVGSSRGLSRIEAPSGTFIMYSAGYRQTALDELSPHDAEPTSVYTRVLLNKLGAPGKALALVAREVRNEVEALALGVGHKQRPAYYDELSSKLVLKNEAITSAMIRPSLSSSRGVSDAAAIELTYWDSVKDSNNAELLQSYLDKFPNGQFVFIAKVRLAEMQGTKPQNSKSVETASLRQPPTQSTDPDLKPNTLEAPVLGKRELTLRVQKQLVRLGCSTSRSDGVWGNKSRRALEAFARHGKVELASLTPDQSTLDLLSKHQARVCPLVCGRGKVLKRGSCVARTCRAGERLNRSGRCVKSNKKRGRIKKAVPKKTAKVRRTKSKKKRVRSSGRCPKGQRYVFISGYCTTKPVRQWE